MLLKLIRVGAYWKGEVSSKVTLRSAFWRWWAFKGPRSPPIVQSRLVRKAPLPKIENKNTDIMQWLSDFKGSNHFASQMQSRVDVTMSSRFGNSDYGSKLAEMEDFTRSLNLK